MIDSAGHTPPPLIDAAALWLCQLPGMTAALVRKLGAAYETAEAVVRAPSGALRSLGVAPSLVARIVAGPREVPRVAAGLKGYERLGIVPMPLLAAAYPDRLRDLADPPLVLYVQGVWPCVPPIALALGMPNADTAAATLWPDLVQAVHGEISFGVLDPALIANATPRVLGVPYGLMLTRQRLPATILKAVAAGTTTVVSIAPPTAQPADDALALQTTMLALADALVLLAPPADDALVAAAHTLGVPPFLLDPQAPLPKSVRRLRLTKAGLRTFRAALGVHVAGAETMRQERLF